MQNEKTKILEIKKNKIYEDQRNFQDEVIKLKTQNQNTLKNMQGSVCEKTKI